MNPTAIQFGFDIATSISIIGAAGAFLYDSYKQNREKKQEILISSLENLRQESIDFVNDIEINLYELNAHNAAVKRGEEVDENFSLKLNKKISIAIIKIETEINFLKEAELLKEFSDDENETLDGYILDLKASYEWYVGAIKGDMTPPKRLEKRFKYMWGAFRTIPIEIYKHVLITTKNKI